MSRKRLLDNILSLGVVQLVSLALPLLTLPYLAQVLGASGLGRMAFALSVAQILVILTDYGFNLSASKAIAVNRDNPQKVASLWCAVSMVRALLSLLGAVLVLLACLFVDTIRNDIYVIAAACTMVLGNILFPQWLFQGLERLRLVSAIQVFARFIAFGCIFLFVGSPDDIVLATFLQAAGTLIGGVLVFPWVMSAIGWRNLQMPRLAGIMEQLRDGWHVFKSTAAINFYTTANAFLLGLMVTPALLGQFHVAERIIRAVQTMYAPISSAVYPHVSRLAAADSAAALRFNRKLLGVLGIMMFCFSLVVLFAADMIIVLVFGDDYRQAADILRIFSFLPVIIVFSNVFGIQTMLPFGMERQFSHVLIVAAVLNFICFIPAVHFFSVNGAAWTNVIVEMYVTVAMALVLHRRGCNPLTAAWQARRKDLSK